MVWCTTHYVDPVVTWEPNCVPTVPPAEVPTEVGVVIVPGHYSSFSHLQRPIILSYNIILCYTSNALTVGASSSRKPFWRLQFVRAVPNSNVQRRSYWLRIWTVGDMESPLHSCRFDQLSNYFQYSLPNPSCLSLPNLLFKVVFRPYQTTEADLSNQAYR